MVLLIILKSAVFCILCLIPVAFMTLMERKLLSLVGFRLGPAKVSVGGLLQPLGDAFKLANKSYNILSNFYLFFYYFSTILILISSLMLFSCWFLYPSPIHYKYSVLMIFMVLGFNSFNCMLSGWSSFCKYSLIGSVRTVSQLISYEAVLYLCLFFFSIVYSSFDFSNVWFFNLNLFLLPFLPCFYIWIPTFLAELNRSPYDFSEGESELVSGFNTEFGSDSFTLIFLSEYMNIVFFCFLTFFLFFLPLTLFFFFFLFFVVWVRSVLPRFRFDKLMGLSWKFFIPFLTFFFCYSLIILF